MRIGSLLMLVLPVLTGCAVDVDLNPELDDKLIEFVENGPEESRPFIEFTSWAWDTVTVVNLETLDESDVKAMTGEDVDIPMSGDGLFIYYKDGKRVRIEMLSARETCSGSYTRDAVVHRRYACWLRDEYVQELPSK